MFTFVGILKIEIPGKMQNFFEENPRVENNHSARKIFFKY